MNKWSGFLSPLLTILTSWCFILKVSADKVVKCIKLIFHFLHGLVAKFGVKVREPKVDRVVLEVRTILNHLVRLHHVIQVIPILNITCDG